MMKLWEIIWSQVTRNLHLHEHLNDLSEQKKPLLHDHVIFHTFHFFVLLKTDQWPQICPSWIYCMFKYIINGFCPVAKWTHLLILVIYLIYTSKHTHSNSFVLKRWGFWKPGIYFCPLKQNKTKESWHTSTTTSVRVNLSLPSVLAVPGQPVQAALRQGHQRQARRRHGQVRRHPGPGNPRRRSDQHYTASPPHFSSKHLQIPTQVAAAAAARSNQKTYPSVSERPRGQWKELKRRCNKWMGLIGVFAVSCVCPPLISVPPAHELKRACRSTRPLLSSGHPHRRLSSGTHHAEVH